MDLVKDPFRTGCTAGSLVSKQDPLRFYSTTRLVNDLVNGMNVATSFDLLCALKIIPSGLSSFDTY